MPICLESCWFPVATASFALTRDPLQCLCGAFGPFGSQGFGSFHCDLVTVEDQQRFTGLSRRRCGFSWAINFREAFKAFCIHLLVAKHRKGSANIGFLKS